MLQSRLDELMTLLGGLAMLLSIAILLSSCASQTINSNACPSLNKIIGEQGWTERWTRNEKEQIFNYDHWIEVNCAVDL